MAIIDKELAIKHAVNAMDGCSHMTAVNVAFALQGVPEMDDELIRKCQSCKSRFDKDTKDKINSALEEVLSKANKHKFEIDDNDECLHDVLELSDLIRIIVDIKERYI